MRKLSNIANIDKKKLVKMILIITFLFIFVLNTLTPLIVDDYSYSFIMGTNTRISNVFDVIISQVNHYFTWGGRSIAHGIAQIFLMFPKFIFNVFNSFMYTLLVYLIYFHSKSVDDNPLALVIINLLLWFILPVFGQTCIWLTGSCNYLWTMVIVLIFLLPYNKNINKKDFFFFISIMFILGIISGWTNENTAVGLLVITTILVILNKKIIQKIKKWNISGLLGALIGFTIMILAPGNYIRSENFVDDYCDYNNFNYFI